MKYVSLAALAVAFSASAVAETQLAPQFVTANRLPQTADEALTAVTVITREQIEAMQANSVVDILRLQTGVDLAQTGGRGGNVSLFLRGSESDHTLVLVDGVRAGSATSGQFAWQHLDPSQIERIEIVRGPRASLYGSDALGGVIQIFTRKPRGLTAYAGAGSYQTYRAQLGYGGGENVRFDVLASVEDSEGFDATDADNFSPDPDDDGYRNRSLSAGVSAPLGAKAELSLRGWLSDSEVEYDQGRQETVNHTLSALFRQQISQRWSHSLRLGHARDRIEDFSMFASTITTHRSSLDWQHDLSLHPDHLLTLGLSYVRDAGENVDQVANATVFDDSTRTRAAFANWLGQFGRHDLQVGARYDHHSEFGGHATGQLAYGYKLSDANRVWVSYGTAFKAPSLNELYHPGYFGFFAGNPDLDPERSRTAEVGFRHQQVGGRRSVELAVFDTRVDDLIDYAGGATGTGAININEARITGLELSYADGAGPYGWQANLTLQNPRDGNGDTLLRRAKRKLALIGNRRFGNSGLVQTELLWVGEREDRNETLDAYALVNLSASVGLYKGLRLEGRIENLLDEDYEHVDTFNTAGRSVFVGLRYSAGE